MSGLKLMTALAMLLVAAGITAAGASAVETLWKWLPGLEKTPFAIETGAVTIETTNKDKLKCEKTTTTVGELTKEATLAKATVKLEKCTFNGEEVENEGSAEAGIVTLMFEFHNCLIAANDAGILVKLTKETKLATAEDKLTLRGAFVILASPNKVLKKTFTLLIQQKEGKQTIKKCEGGAELTLETKINAGMFLATGMEAVSPEWRFTNTEQEIMV
jgi:hypothetical protein